MYTMLLSLHFSRDQKYSRSNYRPPKCTAGRTGSPLLLCLIVQLLAGCHPGNDDPVVTPLAANPPSTAPVSAPLTTLSFQDYGHGHFRGRVTSDQQSYIAEAVITVDGEARIAIWGPNVALNAYSGGDYSTDDLRPDEARQVVGSLEQFDSNRAFGSVLVMGESCTPPDPDRFCGEPTDATIALTLVQRDGLQGEIRMVAGVVEEIWLLDLGPWSIWYSLQASGDFPTGIYRLELAQFSQAGDTVLTVDEAGATFLQSASSGCTASGDMSPHGNGRYYVFDLTLDVQNCSAGYAYLNGSLSGLVTSAQSGYWDYDDNLLAMLSTPEASPPQSAVTFFGRHQ